MKELKEMRIEDLLFGRAAKEGSWNWVWKVWCICCIWLHCCRILDFVSLLLMRTLLALSLGVSMPNDIHCSPGSSAACAVGEDQHSAIAATHQMMSTLLSTRSGSYWPLSIRFGFTDKLRKCVHLRGAYEFCNGITSKLQYVWIERDNLSELTVLYLVYFVEFAVHKSLLLRQGWIFANHCQHKINYFNQIFVLQVVILDCHRHHQPLPFCQYNQTRRP